jgi:ligand-binding sensor domain-containing protein
LFTKKDGIASNIVDCMAEDRAGNVWFGTDSGASRYDGKSFINFTQKEGLTSANNTNCIMQDKKGDMWFATEGGLYIFDGRTFRNLRKQDGLVLERARYVMKDRQDNIWVGTVEGLFYYDGIALHDTLVSKPINYMCADTKGQLWLSVIDSNTHYSQEQLPKNGALYRYDGRTISKVIEKYVPGDSQIFDVKADKAGNIWIATMKGVGRYDGKDFDYFRRY